MIFLYILGGIALLLGLLGAVKLSVRAGYCGTPLVTVKIAFLTLPLVGGETYTPPKKAGKAPATEKKQKKAKKKKQKKKTVPPAEKPPLTSVLSAFRDLLTHLLKGFARHLKIEELRLRVLVATTDAAQTALLYGTVCALVEPVRLLTEQARRVCRKRILIDVECDFLADRPDVDAEFCLSIRVWRLFCIALRSAGPLIDALRLLRAYASARPPAEKAEPQEKEAQALCQ